MSVRDARPKQQQQQKTATKKKQEEEEDDEEAFNNNGGGGGGEDDDDEEEEEADVEDTVDVYLGLPSSSSSSAAHEEEGAYSARFGGSVHRGDCAQCRTASSVVDACTVNAPFGDLVSRQVCVCVCEACGAVTAQRRQQPPPSAVAKTANAPPPPPPPVLFGEKEAAAGTTTMDDLEALLAAATTSKKKSSKQSNKKPKQPALSSATTPPSVLVNFSLEPGLAHEDFSHEAQLLAKYNKEVKELGEEPVAATALRGDDDDEGGLGSFESFFERLSREPRQLVRYAYGSTPLWPVSGMAPKQVPVCEACGSARWFEFQLTPQAVPLFQRFVTSSLSSSSSEWSTIVVFTCEASCGGAGDGRAQEFCVVCDEV